MEAQAAQGAEIARKITISTVAGKAVDWFEKLMVEKEMRLMQVFGFATAGKADASEFGEFVKISGNFRAINLKTGEITNAPQVILPNFLGESLFGALRDPARTGPIKFAFEIGVKLDLTAATKYTYTVRDLLPPSADDPLAQLGAQVLGIAPPSAPPLLQSTTDSDSQTPPAGTPAPTPAPAPNNKKR